MRRFVTAAVLVGLVAAIGQAGEMNFALTGDNTKIAFTGYKPGVKHDGGFKKLKGTATWNGKDVTSLKFNVEIELNSIFTDTDKVTDHLKSPDFFDVKNYPKATFTSSKVEKNGDGYNVQGKLTMHGKTKDVTFPAKITAGGDKLDLSSSFKINRHDWAISYGKGFVEDNVNLTLAVTAKK
jgi:polyisoprenoid-binding protein YceI